MNPGSPGDFVVEETCVDRQRMLAGMLVIQQGLDCVSAGSSPYSFLLPMCFFHFETIRSNRSI